MSYKSSDSEHSRNCVSSGPDHFGKSDEDEVVAEQAAEAGITFAFRFDPDAWHLAGAELVVRDAAPRVGNVDW